jgi:hypothetical protein
MTNPLRRLVPRHQWPYVTSHPLGILFSFGVAVTGLMHLAFPQIFIETTSATLPAGVLAAFNATWLAGGTLSVVGMLRGLRKAESVGMSLLGGGLGAQYAVVCHLIPYGWATGFFILCLSVACFLRARHVARTGYVILEMRRNAGRR